MVSVNESFVETMNAIRVIFRSKFRKKIVVITYDAVLLQTDLTKLKQIDLLLVFRSPIHKAP